MKKNLRNSAILALIMLASNFSNAYVKISAGGYMPQNVKINNLDGESSFGAIGSLALGYDLGNNINIEAALDYMHALEYKVKINNGAEEKYKISIINPMIKTYYNINLNNDMKIYLGAGLGMSYNQNSFSGTNETNEIKKDTNNFAASGIIGVSKNLGKYDINLEYNLGYYGDYKNSNSNTSFNIILHNIKAGVKIHL